MIENTDLVYISGPMTGYADLNKPLFMEVEERLLKQFNCKVYNPATAFGSVLDKPWSYYMKVDIMKVCECDAMMMLSGWSSSRGARLEFDIACALNLDIYHYRTSGEWFVFEHQIL